MARTLRRRGRGRRTLRGRPRRVGRGIRVGRRALRNLLSRRRRTPIKGPSVRNIDNVKSAFRKLRGDKPVRKRRTPPNTTDKKFIGTPMPLVRRDPKKVYPKKGTKMPKKRGLVPPTPNPTIQPITIYDPTKPVKGPKKILTKKNVAKPKPKASKPNVIKQLTNKIAKKDVAAGKKITAKPKRPAVGGLKTSPTTSQPKAKAPVKKAVVKAPKTSARVGPKPSTKEPVYKKTKSTTPVRSGRGRSYGGGAKPKPKVSGTLTKKQKLNIMKQKGSLRKKFR